MGVESSAVLEVCAADIDSVRAAAEGGAARVELCSGLAEGGVTPSVGLIASALGVARGRDVEQGGTMRVHVLVRPRPGDFVYSGDEVECMLADIAECRRLGVHGVVIGALTPVGDVDVAVCRRLVEAAGDMSVTFHRAFDVCADPFKALETIVALGCHRILTSGQAAAAKEGIALLQRLHRQAAGRIKILAGGGVSPANASDLMASGGVDELHASARTQVASAMQFRNPNVSMGVPGADEYSRKITDPSVVMRIISAMKT